MRDLAMTQARIAFDAERAVSCVRAPSQFDIVLSDRIPLSADVDAKST